MIETPDELRVWDDCCKEEKDYTKKELKDYREKFVKGLHEYVVNYFKNLDLEEHFEENLLEDMGEFSLEDYELEDYGIKVKIID